MRLLSPAGDASVHDAYPQAMVISTPENDHVNVTDWDESISLFFFEYLSYVMKDIDV